MTSHGKSSSPHTWGGEGGSTDELGSAPPARSRKRRAPVRPPPARSQKPVRPLPARSPSARPAPTGALAEAARATLPDFAAFPNPGTGAKLEVAFSNDLRSWTESGDLVEILAAAGLPRRFFRGTRSFPMEIRGLGPRILSPQEAVATASKARMTVTLIWPGKVSSSAMRAAISLDSSTTRRSSTSRSRT